MRCEQDYISFAVEKKLPSNPRVLQYDEYYVEFEEQMRKDER